MRRPLFFQHVGNIPKGDLSAASHQLLSEQEASRVQRLIQQRWVASHWVTPTTIELSLPAGQLVPAAPVKNYLKYYKLEIDNPITICYQLASW